MATTAPGKGANRPPVSTHPAFPAIVALWFAALFGIGSMVLPAILLERMVIAMGLPSLIEAATPPLGLGTRAMIAAVAAVLGAAAGMVVARKVIDANTAKPTQARKPRGLAASQAEPPVKRPIFATEELGEEGLGPVADAADDYDTDRDDARPAMPPMPGRRRALSVTDDSGPSDFLHSVPLPGDHDPYRHDPYRHGPYRNVDAPETPLELETIAMRTDGSNFVEEAQVPAGRPFDAPMAMPVIEEAATAESAAVQPGASGEEQAMTEGAFGRRPLDLRRADQFEQPAAPAPFSFAPTMADIPAGGRQVFGQPQSAPALPAITQGEAAAPSVAEAPVALQAQGPAKGSAQGLADLSLADLIARFGRALQAEARAEPQFEPRVFEPVAPDDPFAEGEAAPVPFAFQRTAGAEDTARQIFAAPAAEAAPSAPEFAPISGAAAPFAPPAETADDGTPGMPAALRPLDLADFDEDDSDDDPFTGDLGLTLGDANGERAFGQPTAAATFPGIEPGECDDEDEGNEGAYSSLLSMKSPFGVGREFVRIEEEDADEDVAPEAVVTFPGQAPQATAPAPSGGPRPFDAPLGTAPFAQPGSPLARALPTMPAQKPADPAETERALREALDKLQRMSGAA